MHFWRLAAVKTNTLSQALRKAVKASGLTHYQLGKQAGVAASQLDRFMLPESDPRRRDLRLETASRIAAVLHLTLRPE